MEHPLARRIAGVSGLVFAVLIVLGTAIQTQPPMADDPTGDIVKWVHDNRDAILWGNYVAGFGVGVLLVFAGALRNFFRAAEGDLPGPSSIILIGGAVAAALGLMGGVLLATLAYRLPPNLALIQAIYDVNLISFVFIGFPLAVMIGATSGAILRTGALHRGVAILGIIVATIQLIGAATFSSSGFFMPAGGMGFVAFLSLLIWVIVICIALLRGGRSQAAPAPA